MVPFVLYRRVIFKSKACMARNFDEAGDLIDLIKPILVSLSFETNCFFSSRHCAKMSHPSVFN